MTAADAEFKLLCAKSIDTASIAPTRASHIVVAVALYCGHAIFCIDAHEGNTTSRPNNMFGNFIPITTFRAFRVGIRFLKMSAWAAVKLQGK